MFLCCSGFDYPNAFKSDDPCEHLGRQGGATFLLDDREQSIIFFTQKSFTGGYAVFCGV